MTDGREPVELWACADGPESERIFYRHWPAAGDRALLVFHRGHEHSGRMLGLVRDLGLDDLHVFAWDARGHGRSPGVRGDAPGAAALVDDVARFVRWIGERHGIAVENMAVLGHSVGAAVVAAWVHDHAPPIRALVLATPALRVRLYVPLALPLLRLKQRLFGPGFVRSYVKAGMLTHDREQAAAYRRDPLVFRQISVRVLTGLHDISTRVIEDSGAIETPTLVLTAGKDWVVDAAAQLRFFAGVSARDKRLEALPGSFHAVYHEREGLRERAIAVSREFVRDAFARPSSPTFDLTRADMHGPTQQEFARLSLPLPPLSVRGVHFAVQRLVLRTLGRLSEGIRLGWATGFDSGATLDYVYENRARGWTPLGRLIDRIYLDAIGWRGIRARRGHLQQTLQAALDVLRARGMPLRIVDIAAGHGRYVLEAIRAAQGASACTPIEALLRDRDPQNVAAAERLAARLGVSGVTFAAADAFDRASLAALAPKPTIGVVSGLYELFADNARVLDSLRGLADAIPGGGLLVYTNQPWHPQLEFIARVLVNRQREPWIMRRRTQGEMDALVRAAGFVKRQMLIDEHGIFSVSLAERAR